MDFYRRRTMKNATVMLAEFSKSSADKAATGSIARKVDDVKAVKNEITVRPPN
jgi:osmotically-inducible protein OsmY